MSTLYTPRDWQKPLSQHILDLPRCNVFAKPGMGKTSATLAALQMRGLTEDSFPALVIGPPRVANTVWSSEVDRWARFKGFKVAKVLGTADQRKKALSSGADIFTIHYGLLTWLVETLGGRWPFKTVVADESSRLKNTRAHFRTTKEGQKLVVQGGSKNAGALARAAKATPYWVNLTGTPSSNGLQDLYGQHWFIDFGASLGSSYSAFIARWFYQKRGTSAEQAVFLPYDHAFGEITERMRPYTLSLDPRDWFDIAEPRVVDIPVQLSAPVMKKYKQLQSDLVLEFGDDHRVTAANAAVVVNKLLQIASGHVYKNEGGAEWVHDEKLDALESLYENLNGAPLIVVYNFTADRDAILRKFPEARLLGKGAQQKATEDAWNAGKIPMLLLNPASAGHGLSLQHGGCDLCFYSTGWDAELYEQVIERIGPMRQMQSGYNRVVSVYRLLTKGTYDEIAADTVAGKITLQEAVMAVFKDATK